MIIKKNKKYRKLKRSAGRTKKSKEMAEAGRHRRRVRRHKELQTELDINNPLSRRYGEII